MFEKDSASFAQLITGIGEIYRWQFSAAVIEIYWRILEPFSFEDVRVAIYRHIQNPDVGKYLPKPADIIMAIAGSSQNQALAAWSKTFYGMRVVGGYESVGFDDALIHTIVSDMHNWPKLCSAENKQLPFIEKEFLERYRGYVGKAPSSHPKYLRGIIEMSNRALGYAYPAPVLIGNVIKAREVMATGSDVPFLEISTQKVVRTEKTLSSINKTIINKI